MWLFLILLCFVFAQPLKAVATDKVIVVSIDDFLANNSASKDFPVVPKCCNINEEQNAEGPGCVESLHPQDFNPEIYSINETHAKPVDYDNLTIIIGHKCLHGKIPLDSEQNYQDQNYILEDGRIYTPHLTKKFRNIGEYCLDRMEGIDMIISLLCIDAQKPPRNLYYPIALIFSIPSLIATFCIFVLIKQLRDMHGIILAQYVASLTVAFTALVCVQFDGDKYGDVACKIIAYIIQLSFLFSFGWLNILSYTTYRATKNENNDDLSIVNNRRHLIGYMMLAYGIPLLIAIITIMIDLNPALPHVLVRPGFGESACWFKSKTSGIWYFYGPMGFSIALNIMLFILTLKEIHKQKSLIRIEENIEKMAISNINIRRLTSWLKVIVTLIVIMGIGWIFEIISWAIETDDYVWVVTDIYNGLQGVCIFVITVIFPKPVRFLVWKKINECCQCENVGQEMDELKGTKNKNIETIEYKYR